MASWATQQTSVESHEFSAKSAFCQVPRCAGRPKRLIAGGLGRPHGRALPETVSQSWAGPQWKNYLLEPWDRAGKHRVCVCECVCMRSVARAACAHVREMWRRACASVAWVSCIAGTATWQAWQSSQESTMDIGNIKPPCCASAPFSGFGGMQIFQNITVLTCQCCRP